MLSIESQSILYIMVGFNAKNNTEQLNIHLSMLEKFVLCHSLQPTAFFSRQKLLKQMDPVKPLQNKYYRNVSHETRKLFTLKP